MDTAITIARDLIADVGVEDAWWTITREATCKQDLQVHELLAEITRWRRWVRRRERRGGR